MNIEQERARFKAHYEGLFDLTETTDGWGQPKFAHEHIESIWAGWKARASLQSQDREDAERYRTAFDLLKILFEAWENGPACYNNGDRDEYIGNAFLLDDKTFHACVKVLSIDHARRVEEAK